LPSCNGSQHFKYIHSDINLYTSAITESGKSINRLNILPLKRLSDFFSSLLHISFIVNHLIVENDNPYKQLSKTLIEKILLSILVYFDDKKYNNIY